MKNSFSYVFVNSIAQIGPELWQSFSLDANPFCQYAFLHALETSGSVGKETGWQPHHLVLYKSNKVVCLVPLYKKTHSYGEYVFDFAWANTYKQYGVNYYPKLVSAIPFTPVTGARLLHKPEEDVNELSEVICQLISEELSLKGLSSMHWLFVDQTTSQRLEKHQQLSRRSVQFQWFNRDYADFEDFLAALNSRKRKSIHSERKKIKQADVKIQRLTGMDLTAEHMAFFYECYQQTYLKRSGHTGYLTQSFFSQLFNTMHANLMLVLASQNDQPIASALFFYDDTHLYGRYWGALEDVAQLHFECCYYQGIEFCIEQGIVEFNPGTQGEHKIPRGFEPIYCYSNHQLKELAFHEAIERFIAAENIGLVQYKKDAEALLPFKVTN